MGATLNYNKMQLNKNNGFSVKIDKAYKDSGRLVYSMFENKILSDNGDLYAKFLEKQEVKIFDAINFDQSGLLTINQNIDSLFYDALLIELGANWVKSEDSQNWLFADKPIRLIIGTVESSNEMVNNTDYKALIDEMLIAHDGFIIVNEPTDDYTPKNTIMYVTTIDGNDLPVIAGFINTPDNPDGFIYIENKQA